MNKILFIEGARDRSNGTLRQGFYKLLNQVLAGRMPRINMGNGKNQVIKKFKNNRFNSRGHLLIDLDFPESERERMLAKDDLGGFAEYVYYMIQEMEAWFLSQPAILDQYYKQNISSRIPERNPADIENPSMFLEDLTRNTIKGKYHKVKHGTALLELLDANELIDAFSDFKNLIAEMSA